MLTKTYIPNALTFRSIQMSTEAKGVGSSQTITDETALKVDEILAEFLSKKIDNDEKLHKRKKKKKNKKHKHKKSKSHKSHHRKKSKKSALEVKIKSEDESSDTSADDEHKLSAAHVKSQPASETSDSLNNESVNKKFGTQSVTKEINSSFPNIDAGQIPNVQQDNVSKNSVLRVVQVENVKKNNFPVIRGDNELDIDKRTLTEENILDNTASETNCKEKLVKNVPKIEENTTIKKKDSIHKKQGDLSDGEIVSDTDFESPKKRSDESRKHKKSHKSRSDRRNRSRSLSYEEDESKDRTSSYYSTHKRSRSTSNSHKRSRSRSHDRGRTHSKNKSHRRSHPRRSISSDRGRKRSLSREKSRRSPSHDRNSSSIRKRRHSRSRTPSLKRQKSKSDYNSSKEYEKIDKHKLLEIARKNAINMMQKGQVPAGISTENINKEQLLAITSGGQSVAELTDFCKSLAGKDKEYTSNSDDNVTENSEKSDEDDGPFINHPFKVSENKPNIVMNIRNAVQVPVKTPAEKATEQAKLRIQFPVSSGSQHRVKESEWVPVQQGKKTEVQHSTPTPVKHVETRSTIKKEPEVSVPDIVVPDKASQQTQCALDLGTIVSERLSAVRKLQDNPNDVVALNMMYRAQQKMQSWVQSKQLPGQFTGSTGAQLLSPDQLSGPNQAWVRKDQFHRAQKVEGGMGMYLLQKMGWQPGKGLGKNNEGSTEPLLLDIKMDKRGLVSHGESVKKNAQLQSTHDLSGKHPVSALMELCSKRRWGPPEFSLIFDDGPDHKKNFLFKVKVNGIEYQPSVAGTNKKLAKAQTATVCLQQMGLIPK